MKMEVAGRGPLHDLQWGSVAPSRERHWDLAFVGILSYLLVEYMRLSAQYQFLLPFQVGKVVIGISFLGWLVSPRKSGGDRGPIRRIDLALGFLVFASFLSACFAFDQQAAWSTFIALLRWVLIYFLIGRIVDNSWRLRGFVIALLLLNLKMAQFAVRHYVEFRQMGISERVLAKFGVGAGSVGFFGNQGDFGVAMCVVWPLAAMLIVGETRKSLRVILLVSVTAFTAAIFVSGSRGALLALMIAAFAGWIKNRKRIAAALIVALVLLASVYALPEANKERLRSAVHPETDRTATTRLNLWKAGLAMFTDHPILGVGPGNYAPVYLSKYPVLDPSKEILAPHSLYIESLSELGLLGSLPLVAIVFFVLRLNARTRKLLSSSGGDVHRKFEYRLALALDLALLGYLVSGAFLTVLYYPHLWVLLGLSAGLYSSCARAKPVEAALGPEICQGYLPGGRLGEGIHAEVRAPRRGASESL